MFHDPVHCLILIWCDFSSLAELGEFIKVADHGLTTEVEEGDYNGLVTCMGHLMAVKDRQVKFSSSDFWVPLILWNQSHLIYFRVWQVSNVSSRALCVDVCIDILADIFSSVFLDSSSSISKKVNIIL